MIRRTAGRGEKREKRRKKLVTSGANFQEVQMRDKVTREKPPRCKVNKPKEAANTTTPGTTQDDFLEREKHVLIFSVNL